MYILIYAPESTRREKLQLQLKSRLEILYCKTVNELQNALNQNSPIYVVLDLEPDDTLEVLYSPKLQIELRKISTIIGLGFPGYVHSSALRLDVCIHFSDQGIAALQSFLNNFKSNLNQCTNWDSNEVPFVGKSEKHLAVLEQARTICNADVHVLLTGETGTGKTALARLIHCHSYRSDRPFMHINCASIPENLLESELFGYKKGAFTGAESSRPGKFLAAKNGTILLDEIGEISLFIQAKLLKVLDEKSLFPLGDVKAVDIKARIIAATNQNLGEAVKEKRFRQDLYYRLNTIEIQIPALRERPDDIEDIFYYFLEFHARKFGIQLPEIENGVIDVLKEYDWPGNMRQLQNLVQALLSTQPDSITIRSLPSFLTEIPSSAIHLGKTEYHTLDWIKRTYANHIYKKTGQNKLKTARLLKIDVKTLKKLL